MPIFATSALFCAPLNLSFNSDQIFESAATIRYVFMGCSHSIQFTAQPRPRGQGNPNPPLTSRSQPLVPAPTHATPRYTQPKGTRALKDMGSEMWSGHALRAQSSCANVFPSARLPTPFQFDPLPPQCLTPAPTSDFTSKYSDSNSKSPFAHFLR